MNGIILSANGTIIYYVVMCPLILHFRPAVAAKFVAPPNKFRIWPNFAACRFRWSPVRLSIRTDCAGVEHHPDSCVGRCVIWCGGSCHSTTEGSPSCTQYPATSFGPLSASTTAPSLPLTCSMNARECTVMPCFIDARRSHGDDRRRPPLFLLRRYPISLSRRAPPEES